MTDKPEHISRPLYRFLTESSDPRVVALGSEQEDDLGEAWAMDARHVRDVVASPRSAWDGARDPSFDAGLGVEWCDINSPALDHWRPPGETYCPAHPAPEEPSRFLRAVVMIAEGAVIVAGMCALVGALLLWRSFQ